MTIAFLDSSTFLKLLIDEDGSANAERIWNEASGTIASRLAFPEVSAALSAARRAGRLDRRAERRACSLWDEYAAALDVIEVTPGIADRAAELAAHLVLSGAHAVQLASAVVVPEVLFVTWDRRLAVAAAESGLDVVPAT